MDLFPSIEFEKGTKLKYTQHENSPRDSSFSLPIYEAILGHELGHAEVFFVQGLPAMEAALELFSDSFIPLSQDQILAAYQTCILTGTYSSANIYTDMALLQNGWEKIGIDGRVETWIKMKKSWVE